MNKVFFDISMSLDGFINADNVRPEEPLGEGGERLHEWAFDSQDERDREILTKGIGSIGAVITGRRNYDLSLPWWGADGPTRPARLPVIVVSHSVPGDVPEDGVYTFVDGIDAALSQAKAAAGEKDVTVMGGANIAQQFFRAGLIDEIQIHLIAVLLGRGTRLFEHLGGDHIELEIFEVIDTQAAVHMRFQVVK